MSMTEDMLRRMQADDARLRQTETKEVPIYATGTWTPILFGSGTPGTFTYDTTNTGATWTRLGNRVFVSGRVRITAIAVAPVGNMLINLPLVSATSGFSLAGGIHFDGWTGVTFTAGHTQLMGDIQDAASVIRLLESGSAVATAQVQGANIALVGGVMNFSFAGEYQV